MKDLVHPGSGAYDSHPDEVFFVTYDASISAQVWKAIPRGLFTNTSFDLEVDERVQAIRIARNEGCRDPASEVELKEVDPSFLKKLVQGILSLPPRQRQALLYTIREQRVDGLPLFRAFKAQG